MQADVCPREQVSHNETHQVGRAVGIGKRNDAAAISFLVLGLVPGIKHYPIGDSAVAIIGLECCWSVAVGVVCLRIYFVRHPIAEVEQLLTISNDARLPPAEHRLEIVVERCRLRRVRLQVVLLQISGYTSHRASREGYSFRRSISRTRIDRGSAGLCETRGLNLPCTSARCDTWFHW